MLFITLSLLYFLGELFQTFIEDADSYLQIPPTAATEYDVRMGFMGACRKLLNDDEVIQKKVKVELSIPKTTSEKQPGWNCLSLSYTVPWPLHLVLSPKVYLFCNCDTFLWLHFRFWL